MLKFNLNNIFFIFVLLIITIFIVFVLYYYSSTYKKNLFPVFNNNVNASMYESLGFKKVTYNFGVNSTISFFIPREWVVTENIGFIQVYGDVLTGSLAYIDMLPNSLGVLNKDLCDVFLSYYEQTFKNSDHYNNSNAKYKGMKNFSNTEVCVSEYETKINNFEYEIRNILFLRPNYIFLFFIQLSKSYTDLNDKMKLISDSVEIK